MLTVTGRPLGIRVGSSCRSAFIVVANDSSGRASVEVAAHGITTGTYVYITSTIEDYNGAWRAVVQTGNRFFLQRHDNADFQPFIRMIDINYCLAAFTHRWSAVHLPIVYSLKSNMYPNNTLDTTRTITSVTNDNGYVRLALSGSLGTFNILDSIRISGSTVSGVYQVLVKNSVSNVTINLAFAAYDLVGKSVVIHYNNYHAVIEVWGGIDPTNPMATFKPYRQLATLRVIPDASNKIMFSVHEILKALIETRNDLLLKTLPNNLDFMTNFFIKYYEAYDGSNGTIVETKYSTVIDDGNPGFAVNAKLPFKNRYSGYMSEYLVSGTELADWLTYNTKLVGVIGYYFDISFLNSVSGNLSVVIDKNIQGELIETETQVINPGPGVVRIELNFESPYDQYCVMIRETSSSNPITEKICIDVLDVCRIEKGEDERVRLLEDGEYRLLE